MASNTEGAYPIDPTTPTGLARTEIGDVVGVEQVPPVSGIRDYEFLSDDAIDALLAANVDQPEIAIGKMLNSMAVQLIAAAQDIKVDDIAIKTLERAGQMRELAKDYLSGVLTFGGNNGFSVVALSTHPAYRTPQGTPWPSGF